MSLGFRGAPKALGFQNPTTGLGYHTGTPVATTWYTALDYSEGPGTLHGITTHQVHDEAAAESIAIEITIDGTVVCDAAVVSHDSNQYRTWYILNSNGTVLAFAASTLTYMPADLNMHFKNSIKVRYKQQSAVGTNPVTKCICAWSKYI